MAANNNLTASYLRSILHYDKETGIFTWRTRPPGHFKTSRAHLIRNARFAGAKAGHLCESHGYVQIRIDKKLYLAHRLAWLYMTGEWPVNDIDHINMNRSDNRFSNLREATRSQNLSNTRRRSTNSSGLKGVSWSAGMKAWTAQICHAGVTKNLGYYDCPAAASFAYQIEADKVRGKFERVF